MKKFFANVGLSYRGRTCFGTVSLLCLSLLAWRTAYGQGAQSSSAPEAVAPAPSSFFDALNALSQKFGIALVAEDQPLPALSPSLTSSSASGASVADSGATREQAGDPASPTKPGAPAVSKKRPAATTAETAEAAVQQLATRFDYTVKRQGDVYLLIKRYSNPNDLPDVTVEECRIGLGQADPSQVIAQKQGASLEAQIVSGTNSLLVNGLAHGNRITYDRSRSLFLPSQLYLLTKEFYFRPQRERMIATIHLLDQRYPSDPPFYWKKVGEKSVFGYEARLEPGADYLFLPVSDCDRIQVVPYGVPLPHIRYVLRSTAALPSPDPTEPGTLPQGVRQILDDPASSHAVTLAEAVGALNKRKTDRMIYEVDPAYAAKHVTLAGVDRLSPNTLMQSLAAVYGLSVNRGSSRVVLTTPPSPMPPSPFRIYREFGDFTRRTIPDPIYRVLHARYLAGHKAGSQASPDVLQLQAQYEYQNAATALRNVAIQRFRYLAEPQVKAQADGRQTLSHLDGRARALFTLALTASAYAGQCELADVPLPLYLTYQEDFLQNAVILGGVYPKGGSPKGPYLDDPGYFSRIGRVGDRFFAPDDSARLAIFITYIDQQSGHPSGPIQILDAPLNLQ